MSSNLKWKNKLLNCNYLSNFIFIIKKYFVLYTICSIILLGRWQIIGLNYLWV